MDDAPNYGNTGATIGHELTHGFDDEGRHFDLQGNLKDWWTKKDAEEFEERASCISNQYSQYTVVDDVKGNGKLTLGEDIADLGGTFIAYLAWKHATEGQNLQPRDGLTPDQRFFVGMAQWACGEVRPESKRMDQITNEHSLLEFRVNGVGVQHAGVRARVFLQGRPADDARATLQGLVRLLHVVAMNLFSLKVNVEPRHDVL